MGARTLKPKGVAWRKWPTKSEVERDYKVTAQQVGALCRNQRLTRYACPDQTIRFDPRELEVVFQVEPGEHDDDDAGELGGSSSSADPVVETNRMLLGLVEQLRGELAETRRHADAQIAAERKQANEQIEGFLRLFFKDPMNQVLKASGEATEALRTENKDLREGWSEATKARETLLSQEHERQLLTSMVEDEGKRADERMGMLRTYGPMVLRNIGLNTEAKTVVELVQGLAPEAVDVIATILTPAQKALFEKLRGASKIGAESAPQPEQETPQ